MGQLAGEHSIPSDSDTFSENDPCDTEGIAFGDTGGNLDTNLRRSTRERRPPLWLQEEAWPDGFYAYFHPKMQIIANVCVTT